MSVGVVVAVIFGVFLLAAYIIHRIIRKTIWLVFCAAFFLIGGVKAVHMVKAASHSAQHALKNLAR